MNKILLLLFFITALETTSAERLRGIQAGGMLTCPPRDGGLHVQPNPGNGVFVLTYKSEQKGSLTLSVTDATGKYVYLKSIRDFSGELKETIDLTGNPKGIYFFEVEGDKDREMKKVVFQ
jgi:hypothetical protein